MQVANDVASANCVKGAVERGLAGGEPAFGRRGQQRRVGLGPWSAVMLAFR